MNVRNEVRSHLVCEGVTMQEGLGKLEQQYGWSRSISNLSGKLHRETLRYKEAVELADVLGYEIVWKKRGGEVPMMNEQNQNVDKYDIPVWRKYTLSVQEAAKYFHIGDKKLRKLIDENPDAEFILWNGSRPQIKRRVFEQYVDEKLSAI